MHAAIFKKLIGIFIDSIPGRGGGVGTPRKSHVHTYHATLLFYLHLCGQSNSYTLTK